MHADPERGAPEVRRRCDDTLHGTRVCNAYFWEGMDSWNAYNVSTGAQQLQDDMQLDRKQLGGLGEQQLTGMCGWC